MTNFNSRKFALSASPYSFVDSLLSILRFTEESNKGKCIVSQTYTIICRLA
ncbi:hypothetical protein M7I_0411 [Glarea lozoyensis 74030]|uniref:Uncharacterized protein n=1 Tax=Glarea lozoyensis (strain ATCC 74030 / MF5533) TaxID=1104152 RepID=H0EDA6_GLAL7|nr:hypothetical protein M7I_0411 [Glarea lozoyensis 74030]